MFKSSLTQYSGYAPEQFKVPTTDHSFGIPLKNIEDGNEVLNLSSVKIEKRFTKVNAEDSKVQFAKMHYKNTLKIHK